VLLLKPNLPTPSNTFISPKINLNRLIDSIRPELIIWDGSNYKTYQERWKLTCEAKKTQFHQTSEKGAFLVRY
jgi:competence protein ComEC